MTSLFKPNRLIYASGQGPEAGSEKSRQEIIDGIKTSNPELTALIALAETGTLRDDVLQEIARILETAPAPATPEYKALTLIGTQILQNTPDINVAYLLRDLSSPDSELKKLSQELIAQTERLGRVPDATFLAPYLEKKAQIEALRQKAQPVSQISSGLVQRIEYLQKGVEIFERINWSPSKMSKKKQKEIEKSLLSLNDKFVNLRKLAAEHDKICEDPVMKSIAKLKQDADRLRLQAEVESDQSKKADLESKALEIENRIQEHKSEQDAKAEEIYEKADRLETEIRELAESFAKNNPKFFNELEKIEKIVDMQKILGIAITKIKKFIIPNGVKDRNGNDLSGKIIEITRVEINKKSSAPEIHFKDQNGVKRRMGANGFRKEVLEDLKATPLIEDFDLLNDVLGFKRKALEAGDIFIDPSGENEFQVEKIDSKENTITIKPTRTPANSPPSTPAQNSFNFGDFAYFVGKNGYKRAGDEIEDLEDKQDEDTDEKPSKEKKDKAEELTAKKKAKYIEPTYEAVKSKFGPFGKMIDETYMLSGRDVYTLLKAIFDYFEEKYKRGREFRVGKVGEALGKKGRFKEFMKHQYRKAGEGADFEMRKKEMESENDPRFWLKVVRGEEPRIERFRRYRHQNPYKQYLESSFNLLGEWGRLDLWDTKIWKNIFSFVGARDEHGNPLKVPDDIDPQSPEGQKYYELFRQAINQLWDPGTFEKWERSHYSNYSSRVQSGYDRARNLPSKEKGYENALSEMLQTHHVGEKYIDPHDYEGTIRHAIDFGTSIDLIIFYLIQGLSLKNKKGESLLSFDRLAQISDALGGKFPPLIFLTAPFKRRGEKEDRSYSKLEIQKLGAKFSKENRYKPGKEVQKYIWEKMLTNPTFIEDIAPKIPMKLGELEDGDSNYYIPLVPQGDINSICDIRAGGRKMKETGYIKAFQGFGKYLKVISKKAETEKEPEVKAKYTDAVKEIIKSYVRYEAIMMNRYKREQGELLRITRTDKVLPYSGPMNELIKEIARVSGSPTLLRTVKTIYEGKTPKDIDNAISRFGDDFGIVFRNASVQNAVLKAISNSKNISK